MLPFKGDGAKPRFTLGNLIDAARREARMRREVYPRRVSAGKMKQSAANWEIGAMDEIARVLTELQARARTGEFKPTEEKAP